MLWVRSYRQVDSLDKVYGYRIEAKQGKLVLGERVQLPSTMPTRPMPPVTTIVVRFLDRIAPTRVVKVASIPFWLPVMLIVSFAALPWSSSLLRLRRFSLRTLLIGMTVVAAAVGLIAAASHWVK